VIFRVEVGQAGIMAEYTEMEKDIHLKEQEFPT
jgi:hypothetical protein